MTEDTKTVPQTIAADESSSPLTVLAWADLRIGDVTFEAFVLDHPDGPLRILGQRSVMGEFIERDGHSSQRADGVQPKTASRGNFKRYVDRLPHKYANLKVAPPISFVHPKTGLVAKGYDAIWFSDVIAAYVDALVHGLLKPSQTVLAQRAWDLMRAMNGVAIAALIDEATQYQLVRASDALRRILDRLLWKEPQDWEMLWTPEIVGAVCRAFHVPYDGKGCPKWMAGVIGIVYSIVLGEEVHDEVRRLNPDGPNRHKHHQHFKPELRTITREDLLMVKAIADQSGNRGEFWQRLQRHYRGTPIQLMLSDTSERIRTVKAEPATIKDEK